MNWVSKRRFYEQAHLKATKREEARQILDGLRHNPPAPERQIPVILGTLRRIDPFVFEELLLHIFENDGFHVVRNTAYTGDGGIDGQFYCDDYLYLLQAKRYAQTIAPTHLVDFCDVILKHNAYLGLFIHTGRTGPLSGQCATLANEHLRVISGQKLVELVLHGISSHLELLVK